MKTIYNIAKAELQNLFFSPIAWLILIIFTFQVSSAFAELIIGYARSKALDNPISGLTGLFNGWGGIFDTVQGYLYLYIPLLTMNLMSREYNSGSIKLLYSSPVTNTQIILGKYLSMMIYSLVLIGVIMIYFIYAACTIENFDYPLVLSGLLGVYLLMCAYSAIGLFMSSLTSYQVVAAIGTLTILSILNFIKDWWQDITFVREITYWLSITGRCTKFVQGMICSDDVVYFVVVIFLFVAMTIICLKSKRQKRAIISTWGQYIGVWAVVVLIGYVSSRPRFMSYYDTTYTKKNTLTPNSVDIINKLEGGLTITAYSNMLDEFFWITSPDRMVEDRKSFEQYIRFKPEIKMKYVYYWDKGNFPSFNSKHKHLSDKEKFEKLIKINGYEKEMFLSPEQIRAEIDLSGENNRFVRVLERDNGKKTFLRVFNDNMIYPTEAEISAALKRLVMDLPTVGFLTGHDERNTVNEGDRDYSMVTQAKTFRHSLINQGFDFCSVSLEREIPENVTILVIAEMKKALSREEKINFDKYIERGGNVFIIGEPGRQEVMNPLVADFGVQFMDGTLVHPTADFSADFILSVPTKQAGELNYLYNILYRNNYGVSMPNVAGLEYTTDKGFDVIPLFIADSIGCWNEIETTDFIDEKPVINPNLGEQEKTYTTALALKRKVGDKEQKIIVIGDADCISNGELTRNRNGINAFNYYMISGSFNWLSDGEVPIDIRRPKDIDNNICIGEQGAKITKIVFVWGLSSALLLFAIFIWLRRRGR